MHLGTAEKYCTCSIKTLGTMDIQVCINPPTRGYSFLSDMINNTSTNCLNTSRKMIYVQPAKLLDYVPFLCIEPVPLMVPRSGTTDMMVRHFHKNYIWWEQAFLSGISCSLMASPQSGYRMRMMGLFGFPLQMKTCIPSPNFGLVHLGNCPYQCLHRLLIVRGAREAELVSCHSTHHAGS